LIKVTQANKLCQSRECSQSKSITIVDRVSSLGFQENRIDTTCFLKLPTVPLSPEVLIKMKEIWTMHQKRIPINKGQTLEIF